MTNQPVATQEFIMPEMNRVVDRCPLCSRPTDGMPTITANNIKHTDIAMVYVSCPCGMIYARQYMSNEDILTFYRDGKYREYVADEDAALQSEADHCQEVAQLIFTHVPRVRSVLDIGCATGMLLQAITDHYDHDTDGVATVGVELNDRARETCMKAHGIEAYASLSELKGYTYDLVVLSHVLEHTLNPVQLLGNVWHKVKPNGQLFVQVPLMMAGLPHPLMFTEASIAWMLYRTGYTVTEAARGKYFSLFAEKWPKPEEVIDGK